MVINIAFTSKNMGKGEKLLKEVAARLRPSKKEIENLQNVQQWAVGRLEKVLPADVEVGVMGSVAKGTALAQNNEIDIFLLFGKKYEAAQIKKKGLEFAKKAMRGKKWEVNYAQHPYLKVYEKGVKIDIVPSFKIKEGEGLVTAVDRSQLHKIWANARLDGKKRDDIRLLKQFLKNIGVYGAQARVEGFSGYLCELLIINYGSFERLLKEACAWQRPVIDIEGHYSGEGARELFPSAAIVVIDPTDRKRNVSAVVSQTSLSRFIYASREFLKNPAHMHFFSQKEVHSPIKLKKMMRGRGTALLLLKCPSPKVVEDILWPQLKKSAHAMLAQLKGAEFRVFGHYFYADKKDSFILIELMEEKLPAVRHVIGPYIWHGEHVQAFEKEHERAINLHLEHERIVAIERRDIRDAKELVNAILKNAQKIGVPSTFAKALKSKEWLNIYSSLSDKRVRSIASDYFSRKL